MTEAKTVTSWTVSFSFGPFLGISAMKSTGAPILFTTTHDIKGFSVNRKVQGQFGIDRLILETTTNCGLLNRIPLGMVF